MCTEDTGYPAVFEAGCETRTAWSSGRGVCVVGSFAGRTPDTTPTELERVPEEETSVRRRVLDEMCEIR